MLVDIKFSGRLFQMVGTLQLNNADALRVLARSCLSWIPPPPRVRAVASDRPKQATVL